MAAQETAGASGPARHPPTGREPLLPDADRRGSARGTYRDAVERRRRWREIGMWALWWAALTAAFWSLSGVLGQPAGLAGCAASAVLVIAVGEVGDRLRRRFPSHRDAG